jgi:hypothetical protein
MIRPFHPSLLQNNEQTRHLLVVHCCDKGHSVPTDLAKHVTTLDTIYPRIKVRMHTPRH